MSRRKDFLENAMLERIGKSGIIILKKQDSEVPFCEVQH